MPARRCVPFAPKTASNFSRVPDYEELFSRWHSFAKSRLPKADRQSFLNKLSEEVRELQESPNMEELADCLLVLAGLSAHLPGDLKTELERKIRICEKRDWELQPDGTYHHK